MAIQETHRDESSPALEFNGLYFTESKPKTAAEALVGVAAISREMVKINLVYEGTPNLALQLIYEADNRPVIFGSVYIPTTKSAYRTKCIRDTTERLIALVGKYPSVPIILGGDFNTHPKDFKSTFSELVKYFAYICPKEPTYHNGRTASIIDYVLYTREWLVPTTTFIRDFPEITDHSLLYVTFKDLRPAVPSPSEMRPRRNGMLKARVVLENEATLSLDYYNSIREEDDVESKRKELEKICMGLEKVLLKHNLLTNKSSKHRRPLNNPATELLEERRKIVEKRAELRSEKEVKRLKEIGELLKKNSEMTLWSSVNEMCKAVNFKDFKKMFALIKQNINNQPPPTPKGLSAEKDGPEVLDHAGCMEILRAYLRDMFKKTNFVPPTDYRVTKKFSDASFGYEITMEELTDCIKNAKKVVYGCDGIPIELFKGFLESPSLMELTLYMCNLIYSGAISNRLNTSVMKMIPKKKTSCYVGDMRPIAISTTLPKLVSSIISKRIIKACEEQNVLSREQAGFLPNQETIGQVLDLLEQADRRIDGCTKEEYFCFIDLRNAYTSLSHELLFKILRAKNMPEPIVQYIESIYKNASVVASWGSIDTEHIPIERGLRQGDPLSPILFLLYINEVTAYQGEGKSNMLLYADDMVLHTQSIEEMQQRLNRIGQRLLDLDLHLNHAKCGVIGVMTEDQSKLKTKAISCQGEVIPVVEEYKYLGFNMKVGFSREDIAEALLEKARSKYKTISAFLGNSKYPPFPRVNLLKSVLHPALTYGLELFGNSSEQVKERQLLLNQALRRIVNSQIGTSTILLHWEFDIIPIWIVNILKSVRVWTSPYLLSKTLYDKAKHCVQIENEHVKAKFRYNQFTRMKGLLQFGMVNEDLGKSIRGGYLRSQKRLVNGVYEGAGTVATKFREVRAEIEAVNKPREILIKERREKKFEKLNACDIKLNNLFLFLCNKEFLVNRGIPPSYLYKCGHGSTKETQLKNYLLSNHFFQRSYMRAWSQRPDLFRGFSMIQKIRMRCYQTQATCISYNWYSNKEVKEFFEDTRCAFCGKEDAIEDENHLMNECVCWKRDRRQCLRRIERIIGKRLPENFSIRDFFFSSSSRYYGPNEETKKTGNHRYFRKVIDDFCNLELIGTKPAPLEMDIEENMDSNAVYYKIWEVIGEFMSKVDKKRSRMMYAMTHNPNYWQKFGYNGRASGNYVIPMTTEGMKEIEYLTKNDFYWDDGPESEDEMEEVDRQLDRVAIQEDIPLSTTQGMEIEEEQQMVCSLQEENLVMPGLPEEQDVGEIDRQFHPILGCVLPTVTWVDFEECDEDIIDLTVQSDRESESAVSRKRTNDSEMGEDKRVRRS